MGTITALQEQKRDRRRISVYVDGRYAIGLQELIAAGLKVGQSLSAQDIERLQRRDDAEVAYERTLGFLSYRQRSRAEVLAYLERHDVPEATAEAVLLRLSEAGLVDDQAFATYWVENREAFRPRGTRSLRFELRRKGVADGTIDEATQGLDEAASAYRAALERARRSCSLDRQTFRRRMAAFLLRRGFDYDIVSETVERLWRECQATTVEDPR